jgi:hypothetical protein
MMAFSGQCHYNGMRMDEEVECLERLFAHHSGLLRLERRKE